jgi:hypothetical protein
MMLPKIVLRNFFFAMLGQKNQHNCRTLVYSMSTGCAVLFGGNIYVFQFFPARWYGRRLYKVTLAPSIGTTKHDAS